MNDEQKKSKLQSEINSQIGNAIPTLEEHPLHMLDNQVDPEKKKRVFDIPQSPIRTYEKDMEEALARINNPNITDKESEILMEEKRKREEEAKKLKDKFLEDKIKNQKENEAIMLARKRNADLIPRAEQEHPMVPHADVPIPNLKKESSQIPTPIPTIIPEQNPIPVVENVPVFVPVPIPTPIPTPPPVQKPIPTPPQQIQPEPIPLPKKPEINIRTFEGDVAKAMSSPKSTLANIVIAENTKKTGVNSISNKQDSQIGKKLFIILISLILISAGIAGLYYVYLNSSFSKEPSTTEKETRVNSVITPDIQKIVNTPSLKIDEIKKFTIYQFNNQEINAGKITEFIPTESVGSTTKRITGSQYINALDFRITDTLKRSLTDKWMIGVYSSIDNPDTNIPFIILTTDFFQNAYSGMLKWEATMPEELADILSYREKARLIEESSITDPLSTTTPTESFTRPISSLYNIKGNFKDKVKSNRDVREFISQNGKLLLLYTFLDKDTLLITTSEEVIPALLERIEKQTYVR